MASIPLGCAMFVNLIIHSFSSTPVRNIHFTKKEPYEKNALTAFNTSVAVTDCKEPVLSIG